MNKDKRKKDRNWDLRDMGNPNSPDANMLDWTTEEYLNNLEAGMPPLDPAGSRFSEPM